ncbi:MAG TPA: serine/threonine-protein kinase [Gemmatales bacterium]|nr:serine/threonine-protein kinase [Gemmatales bacterium]
MSDTSLTLIHDAVDVHCRELAAQWRNGSCPSAEVFLQRLGENPNSEDAVRIIYEEICIRQDRGEQANLDELETRFPQWSQELAVLLDCHRLMGSHPVAPLFPSVGETLGDFRLVSELGRGALGVVYLARQQTLSDRPVVLKLSPRKTREHLSLARLQHTHIIPLHAIYEFPARNLIAMCQPYLGGTTLEHILQKLKEMPLSKRTGQSILSILDAKQPKAKQGNAIHSSFRRQLSQCSYPDAICLIGACLADGLQYAHEHDLVHLDIKPSNVLLTSDAQPMLLDFHLALQPLTAGNTAPEWFGGTPAYLSPEHAAACYAAKNGRPLPEAVGPASDLFSLGKLLYVALAGSEAAGDASPPALHIKHPEVGMGLSDIIRKSMQAVPRDRYPSAAQLATDLRCHLEHLPLQGVPNRNWRERWQKWKRRTPYAPLVMGMVLALISGVVILSAMLFDRVQNAKSDLKHGREQLRNQLYHEALYTLNHGKERLQGLPGFSGLREDFNRGMTEARSSQALKNLTELTEKLHYEIEKPGTGSTSQHPLDVACKAIWAKREQIAGNHGERLTDKTRISLFDFIVLWLELSGTGSKPQKLAILSEAEQLLGASTILELQRRLLQGNAIGAEEGLSPGSAWEQVVLGRSLLRSGKIEKASLLFQQALDTRPDDFWPNYYLGICSYQLQRYDEALRWFSVAVALAPASAECYYNRGLAHLALDQKEQAVHEYDKALKVRPKYGAALLNRGHVYFLQKDYLRAKGDFAQALQNGADPVLSHYNLALCQQALKHEAEAVQHLRAALQLRPQYAEAQQLLAQLQQKSPDKLK